MPPVTVPPLTANNFQASLFAYLLAYTSAIAHYSLGSSSVKDQSTNYEGNWQKGPCLGGIVQNQKFWPGGTAFQSVLAGLKLRSGK